MIIRKIHPLSLAKVLAGIYGGLGFVFGALMSLLGFVAPAVLDGEAGPEAWLFRGAVVLLPLVYGLFGLVGGLLVAALYNVVSGSLGGIEVEVD